MYKFSYFVYKINLYTDSCLKRINVVLYIYTSHFVTISMHINSSAVLTFSVCNFAVHCHFYPQPLSAVGVLFSPMVSGQAAGKSLVGLYLRNRKV